MDTKEIVVMTVALVGLATVADAGPVRRVVGKGFLEIFRGMIGGFFSFLFGGL